MDAGHGPERRGGVGYGWALTPRQVLPGAALSDRRTDREHEYRAGKAIIPAAATGFRASSCPCAARPGPYRSVRPSSSCVLKARGCPARRQCRKNGHGRGRRSGQAREDGPEDTEVGELDRALPPTVPVDAFDQDFAIRPDRTRKPSPALASRSLANSRPSAPPESTGPEISSETASEPSCRRISPRR